LAVDTSFRPEPSEIQAQLAQILVSSVFARSERMSRFITFVVKKVQEGHEEQLKESVIGVEVYDRPADYDPKSDPIVRNEARRLRSKLREYYDCDGRDDAIVVELPKGTYVPTFRARTTLRVSEEAPAKNLRPTWWKITAAACVALLLGAGMFLLRSRVKVSTAGGTKNLEALNLYEQGEFFRSQGGHRPLAQLHAADYFKRSIAKDPNYTLAYIGLSDALLKAYIGKNADAALIADAENAARKALQLDGSLGGAHVALGQILAMKRKWVEADREFTTALRLDPKNGDAHLIYAVSDLALTDRLDLAIAEAHRAVQLDPLLADGYGLNGILLLGAHRYDEAIDMARKDLELFPRSEGSQNTLGRAYVQKGMLREAGAAFAKADRMERRAHWAASLAALYVKAGRRAEAEKMLATWKARPTTEFGHAESMAMIYTALGKNDEAVRWLEVAFQDNWPQLAWTKIAPEYESLRRDPLYSALLKRMGLKAAAS
jgi:tetratricopeptide (TPR) repeat protein